MLSRPPLRLVFPEAEEEADELLMARRLIRQNKRTALNKTKTGTATATPTTTWAESVSVVVAEPSTDEENNKKSEIKKKIIVSLYIF